MKGAVVVPHPPGPIEPLVAPPTFSVVIPAYEAAHLIGDAIESALAQTVPPHEVIVCDDGSTDDLTGAISRFGDRIAYLRQEHKGVAAARNLGLHHSTGEFVTVCDADDVLLPKCLETIGELAMTRPDLDILCRASYWVEDGQIGAVTRTPEKPRFPADDIRAGLLSDNLIPSNSAIRRSRLVDIGGYDEGLLCAEDYDIFLRLVLSGSKAGLVLEPLSMLRKRAGSLSTDDVLSFGSRIVALTKVFEQSAMSRRERRLARRHLRRSKAALARAEAIVALERGSPDARRLSLRVVLRRGLGWKTRARAGVAVVAPAWAGRRHRADPTIADASPPIVAPETPDTRRTVSEVVNPPGTGTG